MYRKEEVIAKLKDGSNIYRHIWGIKRFSEVMEENRFMESLKEETMYFSGGLTYTLQFYQYPYRLGQRSQKSSFASVFLKLRNNNIPAGLSVYFSVLNNEGEIAYSRKATPTSNCTGNHQEKHGEYGCIDFLDKQTIVDNLEYFTSNDTLTIVCHFVKESSINNIPDASSINKPSSKYNLYSDLRVLLDNKLLTDVVFVANGIELSAHKLILIARSSVFAGMLENDIMQENKKNSTIEIDDIKPDVLSKMLEFIYYDEVKDIKDYSQQLLYVAVKYNIEGLKVACEQSIFNNLTIHNVFKNLELSDTYNCNNLKTKLLKYIMENAKQIVKDEKFDTITKRLPSLLVDTIRAMA